jgi:nucleotide-binding universal stress UspA family protein
MKNIVVPTDFSKLSAGALPWARKMAATLDAKIHCIHVAREAQYYGGLDIAFSGMMPSTHDLVSSAQRRLDEFIATELGDMADRVLAEVLVGTPFVEIIRHAREIDAAMIIMSTHGYSGLKHVFLGSTTEAVVRKAGCPVLSIRSEELPFVMP